MNLKNVKRPLLLEFLQLPEVETEIRFPEPDFIKLFTSVIYECS
jgi:hypothetical protein